MTQREFSELIARAESVVEALDRWGGVDGISNRIAVIDEFVTKIEAQKEILVQLEKMGRNLYVFKALLTVDEAAAYLHVHPSTVYKLIKSKGLTTTYRPPSTQVLILTEDLVQWCKSYSADTEKKRKENSHE